MAKKETPKIKRDIPYRYVCEHCGTQTEWKIANVTGDTDEAIDRTVIPGLMRNAQQGNFFDLSNITGKCERCGHHQSWELGEAKAWMRRSPLMGLGIGGMIGGVGAFATVFLFGLLGALILFLGISLLGMLGAFIYGLVKYIGIKSDMKKTRLRYMPELIWQQQKSPVQNFPPPLPQGMPQGLPQSLPQGRPQNFPPPVSNATFAPPMPNAAYVPPTPSVTYAPPTPSVTYAPPTPNTTFAPPAPNVTYAPPAPVYRGDNSNSMRYS